MTRSTAWLLALSFAACTSKNPHYVGADLAGADLTSVDGPTFDALPADAALDLPTPSDGGGVPDAGMGSLSPMPGALVFGHGNCGGPAPAAQTLVVSNAGASNVGFVASIDTTQFAFVSAPTGDKIVGAKLTGTIDAGASQMWSVRSAAVPKSATAGLDLMATLSIVTATQTVTVPLSVTPYGVTVAIVPKPVGTIDYDFGSVAIGTDKSTTAFAIENVGNDTVGVSLGTSNNQDFAATVPSGSMLSATPVPVTATFSPMNPGMEQAMVPIVLDAQTPICGTSLTSLTLAGNATGSTASQYTIAPNPITFTQPCGASSMMQNVTLTASTSTAFSWSATIIDGSSNLPADGFAPMPSSGMVNGAQATIQISSVPIASAMTVAAPTYTATLQITVTDSSGTAIYTAPITETASGVIIASMPDTLMMSAPGSANFTLGNNGTPVDNLMFDAALGIAKGAKFTLSGPASQGAYTVTAGALNKTTQATDTVNVSVAGGVGSVAVCNANGMLTIPVTASLVSPPPP